MSDDILAATEDMNQVNGLLRIALNKLGGPLALSHHDHSHKE